MENSQILAHVDHTLLTATASRKEIFTLCREAIEFRTATVCIPPSYTEEVHIEFGEKLKICNVIGFPLGYNRTSAKVAEAKIAIEHGADELDMVINLGDVKNGDFCAVTAEIAALKTVCGEKVLKVIVETCCLTEEEKIALCGCVTEGNADYIKTSTGFGTGGATMEDILLFKKHIGAGVKIKASGGVRTREAMVAFLEAGCDRLGTSSAIKILAGETPAGY
ncbi:deoxyribose-phosphate aldolase [Clostridia bacterium]|nr:deoxyribose-phosphate aldolase [Clostridia bacterium]